MVSQSIPEQPALLTSWKEIANYLGKGVRTVQRWELQYGLPVRRPNEKAKGVVHASCRELEDWLNKDWSQRGRQRSPGQVSGADQSIQAVRASIQEASQLRRANSMLVEGIRASVITMRKQFQSLTGHMDVNPKPR